MLFLFIIFDVLILLNTIIPKYFVCSSTKLLFYVNA